MNPPSGRGRRRVPPSDRSLSRSKKRMVSITGDVTRSTYIHRAYLFVGTYLNMFSSNRNLSRLILICFRSSSWWSFLQIEIQKCPPPPHTSPRAQWFQLWRNMYNDTVCACGQCCLWDAMGKMIQVNSHPITGMICCGSFFSLPLSSPTTQHLEADKIGLWANPNAGWSRQVSYRQGFYIDVCRSVHFASPRHASIIGVFFENVSVVIDNLSIFFLVYAISIFIDNYRYFLILSINSDMLLFLPIRFRYFLILTINNDMLPLLPIFIDNSHTFIDIYRHISWR